MSLLCSITEIVVGMGETPSSSVLQWTNGVASRSPVARSGSLALMITIFFKMLMWLGSRYAVTPGHCDIIFTLKKAVQLESCVACMYVFTCPQACRVRLEKT